MSSIIIVINLSFYRQRNSFDLLRKKRTNTIQTENNHLNIHLLVNCILVLYLYFFIFFIFLFLLYFRNFEIHSPEEIDDYIKQELSPSAHLNSSAAAAILHSKPLRPGRGKGTRTVAKFSSDST